jgi:integrase
MAKILFTNSFLKSLLTASNCEYSDQKTSGLVIRKQGQRISWALRYSLSSKQRRITLGQYPLVSLQEARAIALKKLQLITLKIDPILEEKQASIKGTTFADFALEWLDSLADSNKSLAHIKKSMKYVEIIEKSEAGKMLLKEVRARDLDKLLTPYFSDTPYKHNRLRSAVTAIFNMAVRYDHIDRNPAIGLKRAIENARNEVFSVEDYRSIVKSAENINTVESFSILLMAFTGCRPSDAFRAEWSEFDLVGGKWTRSATKTKQRNEQVVEISDKTIKLIQKIPKSNEKWVFPSRSRSGHLEEVRKTWKTICKAASVDGNLYQLRKFVATQLIKQGVNIKQLQQIMAWKNAATPLKHYVKVGTGECKDQLDKLFNSL